MSNPTSISRRIEECISRYEHHDYEGAMINLFPAIDKTAKKRRPKDRVGKRIKSFLKDEETLISIIGTGNNLSGCSFDGITFEEAMYKFGRTTIVHEGELDSRLTFKHQTKWTISKDNWCLSTSYIVGMLTAVIISPENSLEKLTNEYSITIMKKNFIINDIWGDPAPIYKHLRDYNDLFSKT